VIQRILGTVEFLPVPEERLIAERLRCIKITIMNVTLTIPDALASSLSRAQPVLPRVLLEGFAVEAYRQGILSAAEVRVLMGHDSRWETEDFLSAHDSWPGTNAEQVADDGRKLNALLGQ